MAQRVATQSTSSDLSPTPSVCVELTELSESQSRAAEPDSSAESSLGLEATILESQLKVVNLPGHDSYD